MRGWILIVPFATSCAAPPASMDAALRTDAVADAASDPCEPFGRFGAPLETFTLPGPDGVGAMYIPDVQARFPAVRWSTLDRLYVPAGTYALINLGNLPVRTAEHPLVITNHGGQVVLRPPAGSHYGYLWVLNGGAHWVATGRFDPVSGTGDAAFPGHRCGAYANSRGTYGFLSDDAFLNAGHMGLAIGDARFVEAEFIEITRAGFAGLRVLSSVQAAGTRPTLDGYDLHDLYIHDTKSEGVYFGWTGAPPSPLSSGLRVHHNRFVRTGAEALQVQNLGDGTEIHHNAVAFAALDWRAAFQNYQDNNAQVQVRSGAIRVHHNAFVGAAANLLLLFSGPEGSDGPRTVTFEDNHFADTLSLGAYLGGTSGPGSSYAFRRNAFRGLDFGYDSLVPTAPNYGVVFRAAATFTSPVTVVDGEWEGAAHLAAGLASGDGAAGIFTATGNRNGAVVPFAFADTGLPDGTPTRRLELWTDRATLAPGMPAMTYAPGALVMYDAELYRCRVANSGQVPPTSPASWEHLPLPVDDLRTAPGTVWAARDVGLPATR